MLINKRHQQGYFMSCSIFIFYSISFFAALFICLFLYIQRVYRKSLLCWHSWCLTIFNNQYVLKAMHLIAWIMECSRDMLHVVFMRTYNRPICFIKGQNVAQQHRSDLFYIFPPPPICASSVSSPSLLSLFSLSHLSSEQSLRRYSIRQVVNTGEKGVQCHVTVSQSMTEPGTGPSSPGNKYIAIFLFRV